MDRALLPEPLTIELTMMLVIFLTSINYLFIWFQNRGPAGLLWMLAASLLSSLAFALRLALHGHPGTVIAGACMLVALSCVWTGFRTTAGRRPWLPALIVPAAVWLVICCIPGFFHPPATRFAVAYLLAALLLALTLRELWPTQAERRIARWLVTGFLGLQILLCLAWGMAQAVSLLHALPFGAKAVDLPMAAFTLLSFSLIMSFAFVALIKEQSDWDLWQETRQDALTGLGNRRHLDDTLEAAVRASRRTGAPLALLMIDVDQFKTFNDHYGHPAGDACLRAIAGALRGGLLRREDAVSRYGGEEFTVILANTREAEAVAVAERLRLAVRALKLPHAGRAEAIVTISLGVAVMGESAASTILDAATLIHAADHALYRAKEAGRDRVASFEGTVAAPPPTIVPAPSLRLDPA
jgi:diguanylate cyclase (GGDEF)-like protein